MPPKKIIVILTLGRSGSSAITRGLQALGVDLGDQFVGGSHEINPKGFWEDVEIERINDDILYALKSHIGGLSVITERKIELQVPQYLRDRAKELLKRKIETRSMYGFKDVRIYQLLPFWKPIFADLSLEATYIMAVRNPVSVAKSMLKINENWFFEEKSYLRWFQHIVTIMLNTNGEKRVVVDYDQLLAAPEHQVNRIATAIGLQSSEIDQKSLSEYTKHFLEKSLRHHNPSFSSELEDEIPFFPELIREIYKILQKISNDQINIDSPEAKNFFFGCAAKLEHISPAIQAVHDLEISLLDTRDRLEKIIVQQLARSTSDQRKIHTRS